MITRVKVWNDGIVFLFSEWTILFKVRWKNVWPFSIEAHPSTKVMKVCAYVTVVLLILVLPAFSMFHYMQALLKPSLWSELGTYILQWAQISLGTLVKHLLKSMIMVNSKQKNNIHNTGLF